MSRPLAAGGNKPKPKPKPKMKLKIKPFAKPPSLPADFEATTWAKLSASVTAIQSKLPLTNASGAPVSREELYRSVEDLVVHKFAASTYASLSKMVDEHVSSQIESVAASAPTLEPSSMADFLPLLESVDRAWASHSDAMSSIRSIFLYLDRSYVIQTPNVPALHDVGVSCFRKHFAASPLRSRVIDGLLFLIKCERDREAVPTSLIRSLLRMLVSTSLYSESFAPLFLAQTTLYFREEGLSKISASVPVYLEHTHGRLKQASEQVS